MVSILKLGCGLLGVASLLWAADSLRYGDLAEAFWCGLVGAGWLLFAGGLWAAEPRRALVSGAGLLLAAVGATHWMLDALPHSLLSPWVLYGVGMELAAAAALLFLAVPAWRPGAAWAFPAAFAVILVAGMKLLAGGLTDDLFNAAAILLTLAGAALVVARPGHVYHRALAPASAQG